MADQPVTIAEELATALILALVSKGLFDAGDIAAMNLSPEARDVANSLLLEARSPSGSEWRAEMARRRFVVVRGEEPR